MIKIIKPFFFLFFSIIIIDCGDDLIQIEVNTPSIQCGMCQKTIEVGLGTLKGIAFSKVDLATKKTTVKYNADKVDVKTIENKIALLGYQANTTEADSVAYVSLPACCKIGGMD